MLRQHSNDGPRSGPGSACVERACSDIERMHSHSAASASHGWPAMLPCITYGGRREWIPAQVTRLVGAVAARRDRSPHVHGARVRAWRQRFRGDGSSSRAGAAAAQDATPAAAGAASIGNPAIEHLTTTDKGVIRLYSSWPLTGAYEQIGGDAVEAIKLALEDYGNAAGGFALEYEALDDGIAANNGGWDAGAESANANTRHRRSGRHGLHGDLQLRRGQDLDPDHERSRNGDDLLRQHLSRV